MKAQGKLIKKQKWGNNFLLTFENDRGRLNLVLHQNKENVFNSLAINTLFSFSGHKGKKNYYFINPQSIKSIFQPFRGKSKTRDLFLSQLLEKAKINELASGDLIEKLKKLKNIQSLPQLWQDENYFLNWIKEIVIVLYLADSQLKNNEQTKELNVFLTELKTIFLIDWIHPK